MQMSSQKSSAPSFRNRDENRWHPPKLGKSEPFVKIVKDANIAIRIVIADRDSMTSDLLAHALSRDGRFEAVAIHAFELLKSLSSKSADLIIISSELHCDSGNGFDLAEAVYRANPGALIVMLLNTTTRESVVNAFRVGARGVFSRQQSMAELLDCVEHVRSGCIWAGKEETNTLLEAFRAIPNTSLLSESDLPTLTARELQTVQCAAKGKTNRTIAQELGLSEHTVKNYLFRAFAKLGVSSRVELLFYLTIRGHSFSASGMPLPESLPTPD